MYAMTAATAAPSRVWRVGGYGRFLASTIAAVPALMGLSLWIQALVHLSGVFAMGALAVTGTAAVVSLFAWWVALRPKLEVTAEEVIAVNPWGTQRVALADVVAVTPGFQSARLHLRTGFSVSSWALGDAAGAWPTSGRRVREVAEAIAAAQAARAARPSAG
jgi:hypothetical protein